MQAHPIGRRGGRILDVDSLQAEDIAWLVALCVPEAVGVAQALGFFQSSGLISLERLRRSNLVARTSLQIAGVETGKLLVHGVPYIFPGVLGPVTEGVATGWTLPALRAAMHLLPVPASQAVVWPLSAPLDGLAPALGQRLEPLAWWVPRLSLLSPAFARWMGLVECLRAGRARERAWAMQELTQAWGFAA